MAMTHEDVRAHSRGECAESEHTSPGSGALAVIMAVNPPLPPVVQDRYSACSVTYTVYARSLDT